MKRTPWLLAALMAGMAAQGASPLPVTGLTVTGAQKFTMPSQMAKARRVRRRRTTEGTVRRKVRAERVKFRKVLRYSSASWSGKRIAVCRG